MKTVGGGAKAFTRIELAVVLAVIAALLVMLVPATDRERQQSRRITCIYNLKQIGVAYRVWSNDHGDQFPASTSETNGGWRDLVCLASASTYVWTNYATMANELGQSPSVLVCPTDERKPANTFRDLAANTNISYFSGVNADDTHPQAPLGGDRNLGPGTTQDPEYGFSPANGKGNDVIINGPVCWSLKMHSKGRSPGSGNIMLGDGSAQQVTSGNVYLNWLKPTFQRVKAQGAPTNAAGIRLIFP
jgi:competence protein ComGC